MTKSEASNVVVIRTVTMGYHIILKQWPLSKIPNTTNTIIMMSLYVYCMSVIVNQRLQLSQHGMELLGNYNNPVIAHTIAIDISSPLLNFHCYFSVILYHGRYHHLPVYTSIKCPYYFYAVT